MNKRIARIFKKNKIKVHKINPICKVESNGIDILYFKDSLNQYFGKIDFTMKLISGFYSFKRKRTIK